ELEGQLTGWVERLLGELSSRDIKIEYAWRKERLRELLGSDFRGLIVSMIHKFDGIPKNINTRDNVFVLIDEAHRSTGGDLGNYLMAALPNATLIGFTGTPIDKTAYGKGTFKVFGKEDEEGYLDKYSIAESIADVKQALRKFLAPEWISAIYTPAQKDSEPLPLVAKYQISDSQEKKDRKTFTKAAQNPQILIVTDKLLTGYDAEILYCIYLDKPMRDHVLLQAISRVNRPYEEEGKFKKPCGFVVDFVGVLGKLKKALAFDSKQVDVSKRIESIDVLLARFKELMR